MLFSEIGTFFKSIYKWQYLVDCVLAIMTTMICLLAAINFLLKRKRDNDEKPFNFSLVIQSMPLCLWFST